MTRQTHQPRAWIMFRSGNRIDLLDPKPNAWSDNDLATGLSRTFRWGGHSSWDLPLSVAQHSLTVLAIREAQSRRPLSPGEALRELLHDADEALIGGFDCISPLKPHLGPAYAGISLRLTTAVRARYRLPAWTVRDYEDHKHADRLAAASEAHHVVGWRGKSLRSDLGITLTPLPDDPLETPDALRPWEPWPADLAAELFLAKLKGLQARRSVEDLATVPASTMPRAYISPSGSSARC